MVVGWSGVSVSFGGVFLPAKVSFNAIKRGLVLRW